MKHLPLLTLIILFLLCSCSSTTNKEGHTKNSTGAEVASSQASSNEQRLAYPKEKHLKNVQQLTFGGENAEAYFSYDDKMLVFQRSHKEKGIECDQIYFGEIPTDGGEFKYELVSTGKGRTTCSYFMPGDDKIIYASTHLADANCPPEPDREKIKKYVWPIYDSFELYVSNNDGTDLRQLTDNNFYDAEATLSPTKDKIVYTSNRSGDLELYVMNIDGSNLVQVTSGLGYDGGAFFSPDGKKLVFRSSRPKTPEAIKEYKDLLAEGLVAPTDMEIYVSNIDGSDLTQVTKLGNANWAPFFHPSGEKIIFSSNHASKRGFPFNLFMVNLDGSGLEQITFDDTFDSFPMFSYNGKYIVWGSNRNNGETRDTNLFLAEWVD